jgi:hypothetical protein
VEWVGLNVTTIATIKVSGLAYFAFVRAAEGTDFAVKVDNSKTTAFDWELE